MSLQLAFLPAADSFLLLLQYFLRFLGRRLPFRSSHNRPVWMKPGMRPMDTFRQRHGKRSLADVMMCQHLIPEWRVFRKCLYPMIVNDRRMAFCHSLFLLRAQMIVEGVIVFPPKLARVSLVSQLAGLIAKMPLAVALPSCAGPGHVDAVLRNAQRRRFAVFSRSFSFAAVNLLALLR
jgi:hypothetical protein